MAQVKKLLKGGTPIRIDNVNYNKDLLNKAAEANADLFISNSLMSTDEENQFRSEINDFITNGNISNSSSFLNYLSMLRLYGSAPVYDPRKPIFNGNDYLLNYAIKGYNGNADLWKYDWEDSTEEERRNYLVSYLKLASTNTNYNDYDFAKSPYKTQEELNQAFNQLADAISNEGDEISKETKRLAYTLGIDLDLWVTPKLKEPVELKGFDKQWADIKALLLASGISEEEAENVYKPRYLRKYDRELVTQLNDLLQALDDDEYNSEVSETLRKDAEGVQQVNLAHTPYKPNQEKIRAWQAGDKRRGSNATGTALNNLRYSLLRNPGRFNQDDYDDAEYIYQATNSNFIINPSNTGSLYVWYYDGQQKRFIYVSIYDTILDNISDIALYRKSHRDKWNRNRGYKLGGKILKAQQGMQITPEYEKLLNDKEYSGTFLDYINGVTNEPQTEEENTEPIDENDDFDGSDLTHIVAAGADLAALAASFVPGGAVASLGAGIVSAILDMGADFANVVSGELRFGKFLFNSAVNAGSALLGMIPGGKTEAVMMKVGKYLPRITAALGAMNVAPSILDSFNKLLEGKELSKEDWMGIVQGVRLLTLGIRDLRGIHLSNKYSAGELEIGITNGKKVTLNRQQALEYSTKKTDDERNAFLRSLNKISDEESVTRSLFGLKLDLKTIGEQTFMTPREAASVGINPSTSSYRYAYTINNGFRLPTTSLRTTSLPTTQTLPTPLPQPTRLSVTPSGVSLQAPPGPQVTGRTIYATTAVPGQTGNIFTPPTRTPVQIQAGRARGGYKEGGKIDKFDGGGIFSKFAKLELPKVETWWDNPFNYNYPNFLDNQLKNELYETKIKKPVESGEWAMGHPEEATKTQAWAEGMVQGIKSLLPLTSETGELIPNLQDEFNKYLDSLKNPKTTVDPYRIKDHYLGNKLLIDSYDAVNKMKDLADLQQAAFDTANPAPILPKSNEYLLERAKQAAQSVAYKSLRQINSDPDSYYGAMLLAIDKNNQTGIEYDKLLSNERSLNEAKRIALMNKWGEDVVATANANNAKGVALTNAKINNAINSVYLKWNIDRNYLLDLANQNDKDRMEYYSKLSEALRALNDYITYDYLRRYIGELANKKLDLLYQLLNMKDENGNPVYTADTARLLVDRIFAMSEANLLNLPYYMRNISAIRNINVPTGSMPIWEEYPWESVNNPTGRPSLATNPYVRKLGGSLTYAERKALLDDKLAHADKKQRDKLTYDDYKLTKIRNFKAQLAADKMFANSLNEITKLIFKLINKAIGI